MMLKKIIFWGATGHAMVLREFIGAIGYTLVALFDNNNQVNSPFLDIPLYYGKDGFKRWRKEQRNKEIVCLVAIGGSRGRDRLEIQKYLELNDITPTLCIHPTAFVAKDAKVSRGSQILANAAVCTRVRIGEACIVNTGSIVDHEVILGHGVHVAPGATIAGCVSIGDYTMIGAGAVVLPHVKVGANVIVGAGSVVTKDVPDGKVVSGNPARFRRNNI